VRPGHDDAPRRRVAELGDDVVRAARFGHRAHAQAQARARRAGQRGARPGAQPQDGDADAGTSQRAAEGARPRAHAVVEDEHCGGAGALGVEPLAAQRAYPALHERDLAAA
jgi:hypothetical protein